MINNVYELVQMLPKKFKSIKRKSLNSKQASSSETSSMGLNKIFFLSDQEALAKFEAVFSGSLIGVCLGKKFEGMWAPSPCQIMESYQDLKLKVAHPNKDDLRPSVELNPFSNKSDGFNGDMSMSLALSESLTAASTIDVRNIAMHFRKRYNKDSETLTFATSNITICKQFNMLLATGQFSDNYMLPATQLFHGAGSYGSSAATRVFPLALFTYYSPLEHMLLACDLETRLTHTHIWAVIGAKLQCYAIREAMNTGSFLGAFDFEAFLWRLVEFVAELEKNYERCEDACFQSFDIYSKSLQENLLSYVIQKERLTFVESRHTNDCYSKVLLKVYRLLVKCRKGHRVNFGDVFETKVVSTVQSICLGIICAIVSCDEKCAHELNEKLCSKNSKKDYSPIEKAVFYGLSFSGESATICMLAGAIVGAFCGKKTTPDYLYQMCDNHEEVRKMASDLFHATSSSV